ncbi:MAG: hypothetical protein KAX40_01610 [Herpetosiphon sp.]|nr:hypothetical protein [Herpetosiphon sp.]
MRRSGKNRWLLIIAVGLVLWFVWKRTYFHVYIPLSPLTALIAVILAVAGLYFVLKLIF